MLADLSNKKREVSTQDGLTAAERYNALFVEVSSVFPVYLPAIVAAFQFIIYMLFTENW